MATWTCPKCNKEMKMKAWSHARNCGRVEENFWEKVSKGCWVFKGHILNTGHGEHYQGNGPNRFRMTAHRYAWTLLKGPIPEGMHVLHTCDVPNCVNPDHLYLGTDKENCRDKYLRDRNNTKLTREQARAIREEWRKEPGTGRGGKTNAHELAAKYGVTATTVWAIAAGRMWRHA